MFRTSRQLNSRWIHQHTFGIGIDDADGVGRSVDKIAILFLACPHRHLSAIAFNCYSRQVRRLLHYPKVVRARTSRLMTVNTERSQDFSFRREDWIRPGGSQPMT